MLSTQTQRVQFWKEHFTDTDKAAILNLSNLWSIMGYPGGTRSVFSRTFRAKRQLRCIFLGKKAIIITSKHGTTIFFSHYNLFPEKLKEKLARKALVNTEASISDRSHAPWASHNTPSIQLIQYGRRIGKKVYWLTLQSLSSTALNFCAPAFCFIYQWLAPEIRYINVLGWNCTLFYLGDGARTVSAGI